MQDINNLAFQKKTYCKKNSLHPRLHAKALDRKFGFKIPKIEEKLNQKYRSYDRANDDSNRKKHFEGTQTWIGLHPQVLQTPYNDIYDCFLELEQVSVQKVVDIGSGYGRVGLVMNAFFPEAEFIGYEILKQRGSEGNRIFEKLGLGNCEIRNENVLEIEFELPEAQVYFIYDFSEMSDICQILDILVERSKKYQFYLIARGDRMEYLINKKYNGTWLKHDFISVRDLKIYRFF